VKTPSNVSGTRGALVLSAVLFFLLACGPGQEADQESSYESLTAEYIEAWKDFYPGEAVRLGLDQFLAHAEDRRHAAVRAWVELNRDLLTQVSAAPSTLPIDLRIDLRLLRRQVEEELRRWQDEAAHTTSPRMYADLFRSFSSFPARPLRLAEAEWEGAVAARLQAIPRLTEALTSQLTTGTQAEVDGATRALDTANKNTSELEARFPGVEPHIQPALDAMAEAAEHLAGSISVTEGEVAFPLGRDRYAEELALYYDMDLSPEDVADRALREIDAVRELIAETSRAYWAESRPDEEPPQDIADLVAVVSVAMEENRPSTEQEALAAFTRFAEEAEVFIRENRIATLPADRTLEIVLTPESAGPAQRIGFVDSPPPFHPEPMTVLSLPTIPDTFPESEREDFYRSFNNHFNKMIIIHELFPGHYMQLKIASGNPRQVRTFFPYEPYVEGWATLTEKLALDAGWDDFNKLTYLSHLRKRLENANRAYTSVQVHCFGWTEEEVSRFSEERALLAPQFAKSLFGRLQRGPMQMTSYFMGKDMFMEVLEGEMDRLGPDFEVQAFADTILNAGAVPMDMLPELLAAKVQGP
jgi:uncharacterized protein (DUF885 family)